MKRIIIFILFLFLCHGNNYAQDYNEGVRNNIIYNLTHLDLKTFPDTNSLKVFENAFIFIKKGDKELFSHINDLSKISNAALTELLGSYLGKFLIDTTHLFLEFVIEKTENEQEHLATLALLMDGGGMSNEDYQIVERNLKEYILLKDSKISSISKKYLLLLNEIKNEINKFN